MEISYKNVSLHYLIGNQHSYRVSYLANNLQAKEATNLPVSTLKATLTMKVKFKEIHLEFNYLKKDVLRNI